MNPTIRARLETAKTELEGLHPYPWSAVEAWIERVRPLIRAGCRDHLADFEKAATTPRFASMPLVSSTDAYGRRTDNFERAEAIDRDAHTQIGMAAKGKILGYLSGLLSVPPELLAPDVQPAPASTPHHSHTYNISHSQVGAIASGHAATAHGSVQTAITQADHQARIAEAQQALVRDQDTLDDVGAGIYDALGQFLRIARAIHVEQRTMAEIQAQMKEAIDELWAAQEAKGLKAPLLSGSLEILKELAKNPIMVEVVKKLLAG